jgi:hypothetical protein
MGDNTAYSIVGDMRRFNNSNKQTENNKCLMGSWSVANLKTDYSPDYSPNLKTDYSKMDCLVQYITQFTARLFWKFAPIQWHSVRFEIQGLTFQTGV